MPKRRPDQVHAFRLELNDRERDLAEMAIYGNAAGKLVTGLGTALGGMGHGLGILAAAWVTKEGIEGITDFFKNDKETWEAENINQEGYDAYIMIRTDQWIAAACDQGRYAPAIGDQDRYRCWRALDSSAGPVWQPLTFQEWEAATYPNTPPMTFDQWANAKREAATRERERKLGYGYVKDWVDLKLATLGWKD